MVESLELPELKNLGMTKGTKGQQIIATLQNRFESRSTTNWTEHFTNLDVCVESVSYKSLEQEYANIKLDQNSVNLPIIAL